MSLFVLPRFSLHSDTPSHVSSFIFTDTVDAGRHTLILASDPTGAFAINKAAALAINAFVPAGSYALLVRAVDPDGQYVDVTVTVRAVCSF
jgi:hypothetical protein